ncbi:MAG TPA: hypothetical protein VGC86_10775 [Afipia sp.]
MTATFGGPKYAQARASNIVANTAVIIEMPHRACELDISVKNSRGETSLRRGMAESGMFVI